MNFDAHKVEGKNKVTVVKQWIKNQHKYYVNKYLLL